MRADVALALTELLNAAQKVEKIESLPKKLGARIRWTHNGVEWERVGGNAWKPVAQPESEHYPSEHIARLAHEVV